MTRYLLLSAAICVNVACGQNAEPRMREVDAGRRDAAAGAVPDAGLDASMASPAITDEALFAEDAPIWHFDLELKPSDLATLNQHAVEETYVPGTLVFQKRRYENVAIRYKGSVGTLQGCFDADGKLTCSKLSLKVSFNETDSKGRFAGLRKLVFNACNRDRTCLRERLSYGLFRDMGVQTSRTGHALVRINGGPSQLYSLVEYIDKEFVQDHFADGTGNLYKERWPTYPVESYYVAGLQTNEATPDVQHMLDFAKAMGTTNLGNYDANVAAFLDLEAMGRYTAVDQLINNWDGIWKFYCSAADTCGNHNFYVYDDPTSKLFVIIPWDVDNTFTEPSADMGRSFHDDGPNVCDLKPLKVARTMVAGTRNPQCDPLLQGIYQGAGWERYRNALHELVLGANTNQAAVLERLDRYRARVRQTVASDPSALPLDEWDGAVASLRQIIIAQYKAAQTLLDEPASAPAK
jgi:hypothetical protein